MTLDQASRRVRDRAKECLEVIEKEVEISSINDQVMKRQDELKRAALSADQKLTKFTEYLISKV